MSEEIVKTRLTAGADEATPSHPQYFSWINNTNEGSTEAQTLINLDYFRWLRETYGMRLEIYAWDAGNLDGASGTYEGVGSAKTKAQYPGGYGPVAEAAAGIGTRLGVWCGPDGFGDTAETAKARRDLMVSLCRDFHFAQFKLDGVCGGLRPERQDDFVEMLKECRRYSPDLVVLNHRLPLGKGMPYATTFLWNGQETYVDVFIGNPVTAPHHRAFCFFRGNVPGLERLAEDHGVCISSCPDGFTDDLIYQAFGRCLILAPEIYGNPWFLRDDEQARLARIYNLHYSLRDILTEGILLPESYGPNAVSRGSASSRWIVTGNPTWERKTVTLNLNGEIGLRRTERVRVALHHPYEEVVGEYRYGDRAEVAIPAFRAALIEVSDADAARPMLTGCAYEVLHETDGAVDRVRLLRKSGDVARTDGKPVPEALRGAPLFDDTVREPLYLGRAEPADVAENAEQLFEAAHFGVDMDSLEVRAVRRSGPTAIPAVQAARDAFFAQETYRLRGCEGRLAFDGRDDTFFDGNSRDLYGGYRRDGGCLRVDFGRIFTADEVMIEYFDTDEELERTIQKQLVPPQGDFSTDLLAWTDSRLSGLTVVKKETMRVVVNRVHNVATVSGTRRRITYPVGGCIRYFRLPRPVDRIYRIALLRDGKELTLAAPTVNNLLPSYRDRQPVAAMQRAVVTVRGEDWREGCYLAVALNGVHGSEGAYAVAEIDGKPVGCPDRATSFLANSWESISCVSRDNDRNYTYYLPFRREWCGRPVTIHVLLMNKDQTAVETDVRLCDADIPRGGAEAAL